MDFLYIRKYNWTYTVDPQLSEPQIFGSSDWVMTFQFVKNCALIFYKCLNGALYGFQLSKLFNYLKHTLAPMSLDMQGSTVVKISDANCL